MRCCVCNKHEVNNSPRSAPEPSRGHSGQQSPEHGQLPIFPFPLAFATSHARRRQAGAQTLAQPRLPSWSRPSRKTQVSETKPDHQLFFYKWIICSRPRDRAHCLIIKAHFEHQQIPPRCVSCSLVVWIPASSAPACSGNEHDTASVNAKSLLDFFFFFFFWNKSAAGAFESPSSPGNVLYMCPLRRICPGLQIPEAHAFFFPQLKGTFIGGGGVFPHTSLYRVSEAVETWCN